MKEKTVEELAKELLFYQVALLKIDETLIELKKRVSLDQPELTINPQFCEVSSGYY